MQTIFDIGMYDGADTAYYLELGYRVIAVEANPELVERAREKFAAAIKDERLVCLHAAITADAEGAQLFLRGDDLGSSSVLASRNRNTGSGISVPGTTLEQLCDQFGIPFYLKVDIEGADRFCVLGLSVERRPPFVSFELGDDVDELLTHLGSIGYQRFKIIHQGSFRELARQRCLSERAAFLIMRLMGYGDPRLIRRSGRFFVSGHSSGPVPWRSDGRWHSLEATFARLKRAREQQELVDWYDIQAALD